MELLLQMTECHLGAGTWTQVLYKNKCSWSLSLHSSFLESSHKSWNVEITAHSWWAEHNLELSTILLETSVRRAQVTALAWRSSFWGTAPRGQSHRAVRLVQFWATGTFLICGCVLQFCFGFSKQKMWWCCNEGSQRPIWKHRFTGTKAVGPKCWDKHGTMFCILSPERR